ncbi:hypothetical protein CLAFUW4_04948 [Fulvia fulva]|uniref:Uncharacterized protein n=1 Tax=Passalora fulva TaxID=5499 RepID=A0A9Q8PI53_PASFU|nr:uncharacterized protein CLAFUR5_11957 [Fulvia fulva]KAK4627271.1 hypothetical protein CLAFUR4_04934 [Fulvia fulva]KAK4628647.1 hypothetical protein CLAFUR0_04938 [Fulvia fulva]UJO22835.1 hypothetical protein CLAFUR5_11957 [Fulvia fulva]WPV13774.1 hypothetical protein CLAFUW4_04948 [Fulvia fulva]WPV28126.1 hypothetical protein CLAFUW7_04942 [Fulvia fulva]
MAIANRNHGMREASPFGPSPSPQPTQPLTKRDVRRNRIMEKLNGMLDGFNQNQHQHYRAQLQAVQVDMTLVLRADPYGPDAPLGDQPDDIQDAIQTVMRADANGNAGLSLPQDEAAQQDYWAVAGKRYTDFVREVNDAIERRDADLTALHNGYNASLAELDKTYSQRIQQAEEEHKALSATIRQRLSTTLHKKRQLLLRDKEQLDIADSNAMLMHPNHFSIGNNPGSPSQNGTAINKRTRHLRHNRGPSPAPGELGENGKRKRKFPHGDDDHGNESPAYLAGGRSPFKDARTQREYAQFDAPAYSLERLFTDKELAMATETAKIATYKYFHQPQEKEQGPSSNDTAVPSVDGEVVESAETVPDEQMLDAGTAPTNGTDTPPPSEPPAAATGMERSASHQVLTRGGARANPLAALSDLANAAAAASSTAPIIRDNPFAPVPPAYHAVARSEKSGAPAPPPVNSVDMDNDFNMMNAAGADHPRGDNEDTDMDADAADRARHLRRQLLDQALGMSGVQAPYRLPQLETGPGALIGRGVEREPRSGFAPLLPAAVQIESRTKGITRLEGGSLAAALSGRLGAEPLSRTTSAGGISELGEALGKRGGKGKLV